MSTMFKVDGIRLLGGTPSSAAREIGISVSAVSQWPDFLPPAIADRVIAAIARKVLLPEVIGLARPPQANPDGVPDLQAPDAAAEQPGQGAAQISAEAN
jgi:hypothetical protein